MRACRLPATSPEPIDGVADSLTLRFVGKEEDGTDLHELRAAHVAEVLQGLVGLSSDFTKAGAFGNEAMGSEVLVRPAQEGSFIMEVVRVVVDHANVIGQAAGVIALPTLSQVIWWATRSARADVKDFEHLESGNVKVHWQDDTAVEIPAAAWTELQKRDRRRKKQLRQIMAPLSDPRVSSVEVQSTQDEPEAAAQAQEVSTPYTLTRPDYNALRLEDEVTERHEIFDIEARMSAIDFDNPTRWRVKTKTVTRAATVEDQELLGRLGLASE